MSSANPSRRLDLTLCLIIFISGIVLRLLLLTPSGFDGLYGQDAYAYYDFAHELRDAINEGRAPGSFFWPLGYPLLLLAGFTLFGNQITVAQGLNVLLGSALPCLIYILARTIGLRRTGALTAAILMAVCGQAMQSSLVIMSDIPALFWAIASGVMLALYLKPSSNRTSSLTLWLALSAGLLAFASITRWIYLLLAVPWGLVVLMRSRGRIQRREILSTLIATSIVFLPQLVYNRIMPSPGLNHAWVEGWSLSHALEREFTNIDGHFLYEKANVLYYAQPFYDLYYLAPIFSPFILIGLWRLWKLARVWLIMIGGWALLPYLFLIGIPYQNIRFPLIVLPAVAILVGAGIEMIAEWIQSVEVRGIIIPHTLARLMVFAIVAFGAIQTLHIAEKTIREFIERRQADKAVARWVNNDLPGSSRLYTFGLTLTLKHYTTLKVFELYYETPETLEARWIRGQDDYLLLNLWDIEHQWAGREPDIAYQWFFDLRGLTRLGQYGYYTLFRIKG